MENGFVCYSLGVLTGSLIFLFISYVFNILLKKAETINKLDELKRGNEAIEKSLLELASKLRESYYQSKNQYYKNKQNYSGGNKPYYNRQEAEKGKFNSTKPQQNQYNPSTAVQSTSIKPVKIDSKSLAEEIEQS